MASALNVGPRQIVCWLKSSTKQLSSSALKYSVITAVLLIQTALARKLSNTTSNAPLSLRWKHKDTFWTLKLGGLFWDVHAWIAQCCPGERTIWRLNISTLNFPLEHNRALAKEGKTRVRVYRPNDGWHFKMLHANRLSADLLLLCFWTVGLQTAELVIIDSGIGHGPSITNQVYWLAAGCVRTAVLISSNKTDSTAGPGIRSLTSMTVISELNIESRNNMPPGLHV